MQESDGDGAAAAPASVELSPDCARQVLEQLTLVDLVRAGGISRSWRQQVHSALAERRRLDFNPYRHRIDDAGLQAIVQLSPGLQVVSCCGCALLTDAALEALAAHCARLRDVNLSCVRAFTLEGVRLLCERLPEIRDLQLSGCAIDAGLMRKHFSHLLELEDENDNMGSTD